MTQTGMSAPRFESLLTGDAAAQLEPILRLGPHQFQLGGLPEHAFRIMDEADERLARAFPFVESHIFLKLLAELFFTISRRLALDRQYNSFRLLPGVRSSTKAVRQR